MVRYLALPFGSLILLQKFKVIYELLTVMEFWGGTLEREKATCLWCFRTSQRKGHQGCPIKVAYTRLFT